jgi:hypothetical protein
MLLGGVIDKDATVVEAEVELVELTIAVARAHEQGRCQRMSCWCLRHNVVIGNFTFGSGPRRS